MSSKLAYLSKYTNGDTEKKKKKKKKKKRHSKSHPSTEVHDLDGDPSLSLPPPIDDQDEEEEEPLIVVPPEELPSSAVDNPQRWEKDDSSPRRRHDSSTDSDAGRRRRRHDTDSDSSPPRRRRRHDSDSEESSLHPVKRRHDSDSEESSSRRRRRRRYDSSDDGSNDDSHPRRRQRRYDSSDDDSHPSCRHDSDDDSPPRKRHDSDDESSKERMSSGHVAGLQKSHEFQKAEAELQRRKKEEAQAMVDRHGMGQTVYRDRAGKQVDEPVESKKLPQLDEEAQRQLNMGRRQKLEQEQARQEYESLQQESFARHADHDGLEQLKKQEIRADDPMAAYALKKRAASSNKPMRPMYKGPSPKPNRFGIRPGYRWDGVDRGNGFEDKVLARQYSVGRKKEEAYRWSSADM